MGEVKEHVSNAGEEVVRTMGELSATAQLAAKAAVVAEVDHEEVRSWLTTILKAIIGAFKP